MALSLAQKFINLGMASPLAVEYANQLNVGIYNWRRLAELGMVPILAKYVVDSLRSGTFSGRSAMEKSMPEAVANLTVSGAGYPELVTNGTFDSDISGWINSSTAPGNISWFSGAMRLERVTGSAARTDQMLSVTANSPHRLTFETSATGLGRQMGTAQSLADVIPGAGASVGLNSIDFTPTTPSVWLRFTITGVDTFVFLDNVSVRRI